MPGKPQCHGRVYYVEGYLLRMHGTYLAELLWKACERILVELQLLDVLQMATDAAFLAQGMDISEFIGRKV